LKSATCPLLDSSEWLSKEYEANNASIAQHYTIVAYAVRGARYRFHFFMLYPWSNQVPESNVARQILSDIKELLR